MNKIKKLHPDEFELECTTVWAFPRRGNWATHKSDWRGNWSPEVVRNLILRYSEEGDILLDPMIGGGTTAIEAKILNRHIVCSDVNDKALERTKVSLEFEADNNAWQKIAKRDARNLKKANDESVDFILTHPPYADIIKYSNGELSNDLSNIHDIDVFADEMEKVAYELYRVLKRDKYCAILIGDTRRNKMYQPMAYKVMDRFLKVGFQLKEDIIKRQFNCKATGFWVKRSQERVNLRQKMPIPSIVLSIPLQNQAKPLLVSAKLVAPSLRPSIVITKKSA